MNNAQTQTATGMETLRPVLLDKRPDNSKASRSVARAVSMHLEGKLEDALKDLIKRAKKEDYDLAPFIGISCPGKIEEDGDIAKGAQNLPGNWESSRFSLPSSLHEAIPAIGQDETIIVLHNDAVVQGLSECPFMTDVTQWGVLTIGTGLGNARFTNRPAAGKD